MSKPTNWTISLEPHAIATGDGVLPKPHTDADGVIFYEPATPGYCLKVSLQAADEQSALAAFREYAALRLAGLTDAFLSQARLKVLADYHGKPVANGREFAFADLLRAAESAECERYGVSADAPRLPDKPIRRDATSRLLTLRDSGELQFKLKRKVSQAQRAADWIIRAIQRFAATFSIDTEKRSHIKAELYAARLSFAEAFERLRHAVEEIAESPAGRS